MKIYRNIKPSDIFDREEFEEKTELCLKEMKAVPVELTGSPVPRSYSTLFSPPEGGDVDNFKVAVDGVEINEMLSASVLNRLEELYFSDWIDFCNV